MDFLKLLRSFEELIFEAASWLLFYPRTLLRIVTQPLATMARSDAEQAEAETSRYDDAISPPLFLLMSLALVNLVAIALHVPQPTTASSLSKAVFNSPQNVALFRALVFSLIPLLSAASLLRRQGLRLSRENLRPPFYAQCYLIAPCAIALSLGTTMLQRPELSNLAGLALILLSAAWFLTVQTRWFAQRLAIGWPAAAGIALWAIARALVYMLMIVVPVALL